MPHSLQGRVIERRQGDRRRSGEDPGRAPNGVERRRGDRRQQAAALASAAVLVSSMALPAGAGDAPAGGVRALTSAIAGVHLYVDPASTARQTAEAWRASRPLDAAQMDKIATAPQASWFGGWSGDVLSAVARTVDAATAAGAVPVLVAYDIPNRDCSGGYSAGGSSDAAAYRDWIRRFALGIGGRRAVVILEPDALAQLGQCGDAVQQQTRLDLLWDAVQVLKASPGTSVYIDAGHSRWLSTSVAASRLGAAGVAQADGFSLNVSNFNPTASEVEYGKAVSALVGGKHFVVDTSRNGLGPAGTWCNPGGQALGPRPMTAPGGGKLIDAYLWVKRPGESDGTCNGGPAAGTFWADYALGLAQRSAF